MSDILRLPAEELYKAELEALIKNEKDPVPTGWKMSPRSVLTYIMGGKSGNTVITPKYMGDRRIVEICIATLVTDRALLLIGEPGTAKSWLSEHLTAAINGDSSLVIQGTAGTTEEQIRYSWNYALLLAKGPSHEALVKARCTLRWKPALLRALKRFRAAPARCKTRSSPFFQKSAFPCRSFPRKSLRKRDSPLSPPPTRADKASTRCPPRCSASFNIVCFCPGGYGNRNQHCKYQGRAAFRQLRG